MSYDDVDGSVGCGNTPNCYKGKTRLGRLEFLFGLVLIAIIFYLMIRLYANLFPIDIYGINYLIGKSAPELLLIIFIARLRDTGWSIYLVLILIPVFLLSTRNLVVYMNLNDISKLEGMGILFIQIIPALLFLVVLGCLITFRSESNK